MAYLDEEDDDEGGSEAETRGALASSSAGPMSATGKQYLKNALTETQEGIGRQQTTYDKLQQERLEQVKSQRQILDTTIEKLMASRQPDGVTPLLAAASGFFAPTRTGGTGESFGNALNRLTPALEQEEKQKTALAQNIGNLQFQGAGLTGDLLKQRQGDLVRQMIEGQKQTGKIGMALAKAEQGPKQTALQQMLVAAGIGPGDPRYAHYMQAGINKLTRAPDEPLVEVLQPDGTTRYTPRSQAIGQQGKGIVTTMQVPDPNDPEGKRMITVPVTGATAAKLGLGTQGSGLGQTATNKLQEKLIDASDASARLNDIESSFKPEYQQFATKLKMGARDLKDFVGIPLDENDKKQMGEFFDYKRVTTDNLNRTIKDITGSAMGIEEARRIIATMPNAGDGVFDGDGPVKFKAKLDGVVKATRRAIQRYNYALRNGLDPLKTGIDIEQVPTLIEKRGRAIEQEIRREAPPNVPLDQIRPEIRKRLRQEFGM